MFTTIFNVFKKEGFEDKFVQNLEEFILNGYFKDEILPNNVLKKICDYYFETKRYQTLENIVSCLNFSRYEELDLLETVCTVKKLTTTRVHLIITSNQAGEDSCTKILNGVFDCFQSIAVHIDLDQIK